MYKIVGVYEMKNDFGMFMFEGYILFENVFVILGVNEYDFVRLIMIFLIECKSVEK